jgi:cyclic-di-AMP phosphodiesterase PgpH
VRWSAGFTGAEAQAIFDRLAGSRENPPQPTYRYDAALSRAVQDDAAAKVTTVRRKYPVGTMIFARGQVLDERSLEKDRQELRAYRQHAGLLTLALERLGVFGSVAVIGVAGFGYLATYCGRVRRNPTRMFGIVGLMLGALAISCAGTALEPRLIGVAATVPVVLLAVIVVVAYDQRLAISLAMLQGVLTVVALREPPATLLTMMLGVGAAVWQLEEIRDRQTVIKMGVFVGIALAIGTVASSLLARPLVPQQVMQTIGDASWAGVGGLAVGAIALSLLSFSFLERAFDIATGMTLIELRDPKQPLLRQLQRQAPGTYNHSLNVASISEAAADAIGANALLTYVGALYHDIGKMNKPEYFVENQSGGRSKHDKLSPAMSLLVIVGHVKDGLEMAREFDLPRPVQHFIEAHHGTTLVEYFYHRAKEQAEADEMMENPSEIEYRYPGPKPRTREVAILMLADAVESATRSMSEPTPARIDQLVRDLANKRLLDGQFDECDLTLKDLRKITESISKTVAAIYHGRIAYPKGEKKEEKKEEKRA